MQGFRQTGRVPILPASRSARAGAVAMAGANSLIAPQRACRGWRAEHAEHVLALRFNRANHQWTDCWTSESIRAAASRTHSSSTSVRIAPMLTNRMDRWVFSGYTCLPKGNTCRDSQAGVIPTRRWMPVPWQSRRVPTNWRSDIGRRVKSQRPGATFGQAFNRLAPPMTKETEDLARLIKLLGKWMRRSGHNDNLTGLVEHA